MGKHSAPEPPRSEYDYDCEKCGAKRHEDCITHTGKKAFYYHQARRNLWSAELDRRRKAEKARVSASRSAETLEMMSAVLDQLFSSPKTRKPY